MKETTERTYRRRITLSILLAAAMLLLVGARLHSSADTKRQQPRYLPSKHSAQPPTADLGIASTQHTGERELREQRTKGFYRRLEDPGKEINGQQETNYVRFIDYVQLGRQSESVPIWPFSVVVVGTVVDAKAFVSADRSYVYSDYTINVEDVLKTFASGPSAGEQIVVSRTGGSVRFPSGHLTNYLLAGTGFPQTGGRYVLFLWNANQLVRDYRIDTAYQLTENGVLPLDDGGMHQQYEGMDEMSFLNVVRVAVTAQKEGGR